MKGFSACNRTVARKFGGVFNSTEVKERIIRAFLDEELQLMPQKEETY